MRFDTLALHTTDGLTLHADLAVPEQCRGAAVVCHPHPLYGGDRFNPVVGAVVEACYEAGLAAIRFDFRGVNQSEGTHDGGIAEQLDALCALEAVASLAEDGPVLMTGYSFGSMVALNISDPRVTAWIAVAPPLGMLGGEPAVADDARSKYLIVPEHDQYSPPAATADKSASWANTTLSVVTMADHFLGGRTARVSELVSEIITGLGTA